MIPADPLKELKEFSEKVKKEISNIQDQLKRDNESGIPYANEELMGILKSKQQALRTTIDVAKTHMYGQKEVQFTDIGLQQLNEEKKQLESSLKIIAKNSFAFMNQSQKTYLNSLNNEAKEIEKKHFEDLTLRMKEIRIDEEKQKALIDQEQQRLRQELNKCQTEMQLTEQKLNEISGIQNIEMRESETRKLSQAVVPIQQQRANIQDSVIKLESTKDALDSIIDNAMLDSASYYLNKISEERTKQAVKDVQYDEMLMNCCDICFMIDGSLSMSKLIENVKSRVYDIIDGVKHKFPDVTFRLGCVIYRDIDLGANHTSAIDFSENKDTFIQWLSKVKCISSRNSDECEDVGGGLKRVLKLNWQSPTKCLVQFGDQPCHGRRFYSEKQSLRIKSQIQSQNQALNQLQTHSIPPPSSLYLTPRLMLTKHNQQNSLNGRFTSLKSVPYLFRPSKLNNGHTIHQFATRKEPRMINQLSLQPKLVETNIKYHPISRWDNYPNYPEGVPEASSYEHLFIELKSLGINYNFMKITASTDTMVEEFQKIWKEVGIYAKNSGRPAKFRKYPLDAKSSDFVNQICMAVIDSLTLTKHRAGNTLLKTQRNKANYLKVDQVIIENEVQLTEIEWSAENWPIEHGKLYSANVYVSIDELLDKGVKIFEGEYDVCIRDKPFAKGSFNVAHPALLVANKQKIVAKVTKESHSDLLAKENLMKQELKKKGIAIILAKEFNNLLSKTKKFPWAQLQFIHTFYYKTSSKGLLLEGYIEGKYEKFSNNYDALDPTKETRHLTAFSHFSYQRTNGKFMVTDFQGVNGFLLTDPVLHSKTHEFIETGDYGEKGFTMFFSKHKCNEICEAMNLTMPKIAMAQVPKWVEASFKHSNYSKFKCNNVFCNKELAIDEKFWCNTCNELLKEVKIVTCKYDGSDSHTFQYKNWHYYMLGLHEPKACDDCRKKGGKRTLKDLGDDLTD